MIKYLHPTTFSIAARRLMHTQSPVLVFARVKREEELIELGNRRSDPGCLSGDENSGLRG